MMSQQNVQKRSPHFLIIGSGRLAHHLKHYFQLLQLDYSDWDRSQDAQVLSHNLNQASHVLLAVSDNAIESVYKKHFDGFDKIVVHFSGALNISGAIAAHPLMTFGKDLYDLDFYQKIHFALTGADSLELILPGLTNPFSILPADQKPFYHALCVMGGNFTTLLTQKMLAGFEQLDLPSQSARLYTEKIIENVFANPHQALTGPIARKDKATVDKNLQALTNDPYQKIYTAFVQTHWPEYFATKPSEK